MKTTKIWIGIGTFIVAGNGAWGAPTPGLAQSLATVLVLSRGGLPSDGILPGMMHLAQQHGGEAVQGGEQGVADLPPDLAFAVRIALIRGHLSVGDELVKQGQWAAALPHFLRPGEEIYAGLSEQLDDYRVPPFDRALKALADVVKAKKGGADYTRTRAAVNSALALADASLRDKQSADWAGFIIEAAVELLKIAGGEYGAAIVDRRFAKPVEYQDARGFVWHAEQMIGAVASDLERKDAAALKQVHMSLAEIKKAFPKAMPPKAPVKDQATVIEEIARIELAAGRLM